MNDVMSMTLEAMRVDAARLAGVSANLANVMTPGYKREISTQRVSAAALSFTERMAHAVQDEPVASDVNALDVSRSMRSGTLRATAQPFDFALTGPGFFEIATPGGPAYTRHGQFQMDARGRIVTAQGYAVMGTGGEIVLTRAPTVDASGAFSEDGHVVAKLRVVDFQSPERMQPVDGGYAAAGAARAVDETAVQVRQGQLENANVDPTTEMVDLIKTMRHFESMQRAVQAYDDMLGTGIRKLGDV